jgi:hypothetical protein
MKQAWKIIKRVLLGIFLLLAILVVCLHLAASWMERRAERGWAEIGRPMAEFAKRFPSHGMNDKARNLAVASEALTINLRLDDSPEPRQKKQARAPIGVSPSVTAAQVYLKERLTKPQEPYFPPSEEILGFLSAHEADLAKVRELVREGDEPQWPSDLLSWTRQGPPLLGLLDLQCLFLVDSIHKAHGGDEAGAWASLDASFRLHESLRKRPDTISCLIMIAMSRRSLAVLRGWDQAPASWKNRLDFDYRKSPLDSYQAEAYGFAHRSLDFHKVEELEGASLWTKIGWFSIGRPHFRMMMSQTSMILLDLLRSDQAADYCEDQEGAHKRAVAGRPSWWNIIGKISVPNFGVADRMGPLLVESELTRKVLDLREARDQGNGAWPDRIAGPDSCGVCPSRKWNYRVLPGNRVSLEIEPDLTRRHDKYPIPHSFQSP